MPQLDPHGRPGKHVSRSPTCHTIHCSQPTNVGTSATSYQCATQSTQTQKATHSVASRSAIPLSRTIHITIRISTVRCCSSSLAPPGPDSASSATNTSAGGAVIPAPVNTGLEQQLRTVSNSRGTADLLVLVLAVRSVAEPLDCPRVRGAGSGSCIDPIARERVGASPVHARARAPAAGAPRGAASPWPVRAHFCREVANQIYEPRRIRIGSTAE